MSYDRNSSAPPSSGPTISLVEPTEKTFNEHAHDWAKLLQADKDKNKNKDKDKDGESKNASSQLRRFYDEVLMWQQRVRGDKEKLARYLPLIQMLNAKVSYASGRGHVTDTFVTMMRQCLAQIDAEKPASLDNFKLFFEAVIGFRRYEEELANRNNHQGRR